MSNQYHYVPTLKGKEAEYGALKELKGKPKGIPPLWETPLLTFFCLLKN